VKFIIHAVINPMSYEEDPENDTQKAPGSGRMIAKLFRSWCNMGRPV
jgi:hypothetical protein